MTPETPQQEEDRPAIRDHGSYVVGPDVMRHHPESAYLFSGGPVRPATDAERAEYEARAHSPDWRDLYLPGPDEGQDAAETVQAGLAGASRAAGGAAARESVAAVLAAKDGTERKWAA